MHTKVYPFQSKNGLIYIEAESQEFDDSALKQDDDDGVVTVGKRSVVKEGMRKFEESLGILEEVSESVLTKVSGTNATEIKLELGLKFDGELGVPYIARCASEANFKVTLTWKGEWSSEYQRSLVGKHQPIMDEEEHQPMVDEKNTPLADES